MTHSCGWDVLTALFVVVALVYSIALDDRGRKWLASALRVSAGFFLTIMIYGWIT
jgi:hypothetical protein